MRDPSASFLREVLPVTETAIKPRCLHDVFADQARRYPESLAVTCRAGRLTYEELDVNSTALAWRLRDHGVGPEVLVGIVGLRTLEMVVAVIAVLKAGGAYVPIDPTDPPGRVRYLFEDSRLRAVIGPSSQLTTWRISESDAIRFEQLLSLKDLRGRKESVVASAMPENRAVVIYTSGSTGRANAVEVSHRALFNRYVDGYRPLAGDLQKASLTVMAHFSDLLMPLLSGNAVNIVADDELATVAGMSNAMIEHGTKRVALVPTQLSAMLDGDDHIRAALCSLEKIIVSGEALPVPLLEAFTMACPSVSLMNAWGSSENAGLVCMAPVRPGGVVSVGYPLSGTEVWVLDDSLSPVPPGGIGELYIGGSQLARGYLRRPRLTAERFIPHPSALNGERLFRTGDLGRWHVNEGLEVLGRTDNLVKVRGFRVDLNEVQRVLEEHPAVLRAFAVLEELEGESYLTGYVQLQPEIGGLDAAALRRHAANRLPSHAVPARLVPTATLPLLPNGKVDRAKLLSARGAELTTSPQNTATQQALMEVWAQVLKGVPVSVRDNFFQIGGDSIRAMRVVALASRRGINLKLEQLAKYPTIEALAQFVDGPAN